MGAEYPTILVILRGACRLALNLNWEWISGAYWEGLNSFCGLYINQITNNDNTSSLHGQ